MEISKPTASRQVRPASGSAETELDELMAILGDAPDADESAVDDADLALLLEGLGATAKEREEAEVRQLLEGLPELFEETDATSRTTISPPVEPMVLGAALQLPESELSVELELVPAAEQTSELNLGREPSSASDEGVTGELGEAITSQPVPEQALALTAIASAQSSEAQVSAERGSAERESEAQVSAERGSAEWVLPERESAERESEAQVSAEWVSAERESEALVSAERGSAERASEALVSAERGSAERASEAQVSAERDSAELATEVLATDSSGAEWTEAQGVDREVVMVDPSATDAGGINLAPEDLEEVDDPDQMTIEAFEASEEELLDTENAVQQQGAGNLSLPIRHRAVPHPKATAKPKLSVELKPVADARPFPTVRPPFPPDLFGPDDSPPIPIEELEEPDPGPELKDTLAALARPLPDEEEPLSESVPAALHTALPSREGHEALGAASLGGVGSASPLISAEKVAPDPATLETPPPERPLPERSAPVSLRELLPLQPEPVVPKLEPPPSRLRELPTEPELGLPPMRDPLAARRALAGERLEQFLKEDVQTLLAFRILRFYVASGLERLTHDELQEELVEGRESLTKALTQLITAGLMLLEGQHYVLNTRARKLSLLGTAVAQWQTPRRREQLLSWLKLS